ncbi:hypothetical protein [Timonella senegalensis]|uniref:hypothetical protein n=1 Tax=Timonella senegalensis TaxID=1465825 RepID=UPI0028ACC4F1|nr:hypothetical protein [Timonella senegalensis]
MSENPNVNPIESGQRIISIPRWIEVKDLRQQAEDSAPSRATHYVVSPHCEPRVAENLAAVYAQRERYERTFAVMELVQVPILLLGAALFLVVVIKDLPIGWALVPLALYAAALYVHHDVELEVATPLDVAELERSSAGRVLHRISGADYRQVNAFAQENPDRAVEAHLLMWRVQELGELLRSVRRELASMAGADLVTNEELDVAQHKMLALEALIKDGEQSLRSLLNPQYRQLPVGRDGLLDLLHRVDKALSEGRAQLAPRVAKERERMNEYQQSLNLLEGQIDPPSADATQA